MGYVAKVQAPDARGGRIGACVEVNSVDPSGRTCFYYAFVRNRPPYSEGIAARRFRRCRYAGDHQVRIHRIQPDDGDRPDLVVVIVDFVRVVGVDVDRQRVLQDDRIWVCPRGDVIRP